jgi:hypothetical protein
VTLPDEILADATEAASEQTDQATEKHTTEQREHLASLAQDYDDRWEYSAKGGFRIHREHFTASWGFDIHEDIPVEIDCYWMNGAIHLAVEHDAEGIEYAGAGLEIGAETAEALALDLLELAQEARECRETDDA